MKNTFLAKTYTITLTVPRAIVCGAVSLILISWFFFLGLVVGRGYEPENIIPQLAQVMPQPGEIVADGPSLTPPSSTQPQPAESNGRSIVAEADRAYRANIRQESASTNTATPPSLKPPAAGQGANQAGQPANTSNQTAGQTTGAKNQSQGGGETYKFVYQLASFKEEKAAQDLKNKLVAAGFTTRISTSKGAQSTWYRLIVDFTGTQNQADAARANLKKNFKIGEPLKLSQKKTGA